MLVKGAELTTLENEVLCLSRGMLACLVLEDLPLVVEGQLELKPSSCAEHALLGSRKCVLNMPVVSVGSGQKAISLHIHQGAVKAF